MIVRSAWRGGGREVLRQVAAGLVLGVMAVSLALSFAVLIFRGELAADLAVGAGWALVGVVVVGLVMAVGSSVRGLAAGPQDIPSVLVAAVAADIVVSAADPLATLTAFVVVGTALTGLAFVLLGRHHLGGLVRFVPYPVVAGFLGGTSLVLIRAGLSLLTGGGATGDMWMRLLPGVGLALALVWIGRRPTPSPYLPAVVVVGAAVGYHVVASLADISRSEALDRGFVLGPFPSGDMMDLGAVTRLADADWGAVLGQVPAMVALALLVALGMLLNVGAMEHTLDRDVDVDRELVANGVGLLAAAPFAGLPGFVLLGDTVMGRRIGGDSRIPPVLAVGFASVVLAMGTSVLTYVPVLVPAGLLIMIGLDFAVRWLWDVRHQVELVEHAVIFGIVIVMATLGFLEGVAVGILAASVMFVVRYSRVRAVRSLTTLRDRRSHVQRPIADEALLDQEGSRVVIAELEGFVFFGTAEQMVGTLEERFAGDADVEVLVVDLARVTGLDSSAVASFRRLGRHARKTGIEVVLSGCRPGLRAILAPVVVDDGFAEAADLDHALEDMEERLLDGADEAGVEGGGSRRHESDPVPWADTPATSLAAGAVIVAEGARDSGVFLLEEGRAVVEIARDGDGTRRAVLLPGTVIGELSLLSGRPANATVTCDTECVVRHLTAAAVADMAISDPVRALALHRFLARRLARKLDAADRTIASLR